MKPYVPVSVVFGMTALSDLIKLGRVRGSVFFGTFVWGTLLMLLYEIRADLAMGFGWLSAITAVLVNGRTVFTSIQKGL